MVKALPGVVLEEVFRGLHFPSHSFSNLAGLARALADRTTLRRFLKSTLKQSGAQPDLQASLAYYNT